MKVSIYCVGFSLYLCPGMGLDLGKRLAMLKKDEQFSSLFLLIETQPKEASVWINRSRLDTQAVEDKKRS